MSTFSLRDFFYLLFAFVVIALQSSSAIALFSVKANLTLAFLVAVGFFIKKPTIYLFLSFISALLLPIQPGFSKEFFVIFFVAMLSYYVQRKLVAGQLATLVFLIFFSTFIWYLLLAVSQIASIIFLLELVLNTAASLVFLYIFNLLKHERI